MGLSLIPVQQARGVVAAMMDPNQPVNSVYPSHQIQARFRVLDPRGFVGIMKVTIHVVCHRENAIRYSFVRRLVIFLTSVIGIEGTWQGTLRTRNTAPPEPACGADAQANGTEHLWYVTHESRNEPCTGKAPGPLNPIPAPIEEEVSSSKVRGGKGAVEETARGIGPGRKSKKGSAATDKHRFKVCPQTHKRCTNCPCTKCRGKSLCQHSRQRHKCKDCQGTGLV